MRRLSRNLSHGFIIGLLGYSIAILFEWLNRIIKSFRFMSYKNNAKVPQTICIFLCFLTPSKSLWFIVKNPHRLDVLIGDRRDNLASLSALG